MSVLFLRDVREERTEPTTLRPEIPEEVPELPGFWGRMGAALRYLLCGILPTRGLLPGGRRVAVDETRIVIDGDFEICSTGSLAVRARRHLFLESGEGTTPGGRPWIVSINGERENFRPIAMRRGRIEVWDA